MAYIDHLREIRKLKAHTRQSNFLCLILGLILGIGATIFTVYRGPIAARDNAIEDLTHKLVVTSKDLDICQHGLFQ